MPIGYCPLCSCSFCRREMEEERQAGLYRDDDWEDCGRSYDFYSEADYEADYYSRLDEYPEDAPLDYPEDEKEIYFEWFEEEKNAAVETVHMFCASKGAARKRRIHDRKTKKEKLSHKRPKAAQSKAKLAGFSIESLILRTAIICLS